MVFFYLVAQLVLDVLLDTAEHERLEDHVETVELVAIQPLFALARRVALNVLPRKIKKKK